MPIHREILDNPKSDRVRRLAELLRPKGRDRAGRFLVEGPQAVREAVACHPEAVRDLYVAAVEEPDSYAVTDPTLEAIVESSQQAPSPIYVHLMTEETLARVSRDAQGILAVVDTQCLADAAETARREGTARFVAAFWQVRDPGNAGAVIRAADAAGCDAVVLVDDCVDPTNPKVVRATAGSLFHLPVLHMDADGFLAWASRLGLDVIAADVHGLPDLKPRPLPGMLADPAFSGPKAVLFGNEARGLPDTLLRRSTHVATIPLYGKAESLNLATSAAVMLMAFAWQGAMSGHIGTM